MAAVPKVSVITCTHNPRRDYLDLVIDGLRAQTADLCNWEYLVIDNASDPDRRPSVDLSWHPHTRIVREEKLGLTAARLRGIVESQGTILVFVDDDNVLAPDYLDHVIQIADHKPFIGAWSGQCLPQFEKAPPEWTRRYWGNLVIREFANDVWSNLPRLDLTMPCGAGLCVRRVVANRYVHLHESGQRKFQFDRTGNSLLSGGDNDLAACACDVGLGVGLFHSLKLTHLIPSERLSVDYLSRLAEGIQFSSILLDAAREGAPPPASLSGWMADQLRLIRLRGPHRTIRKAVYRGRSRARRHLQDAQ